MFVKNVKSEKSIFSYGKRSPQPKYHIPRCCWGKNDRSHAMDISRITKVILKKLQKNRKNDPFSRKNWNFQKKVFNSLWYKVLSTQISHP